MDIIHDLNSQVNSSMKKPVSIYWQYSFVTMRINFQQLYDIWT